MKVLLDHNLSKKIRIFLPGHLVRTAWQEGWSTLSNGDLLNAAESHGFQVLITADQGIVYQQNNQLRTISLVVLTSPKWVLVQQHGDAILASVERCAPGSYETIVIPLPSKSR